LGKEAFICKCNKQWPIGRVEWSLLSREQGRAYFVSSGEIGVLVICTIMPAFIAGLLVLARQRIARQARAALSYDHP
jgi:hypothetical protein